MWQGLTHEGSPHSCPVPSLGTQGEGGFSKLASPLHLPEVFTFKHPKCDGL